MLKEAVASISFDAFVKDFHFPFGSCPADAASATTLTNSPSHSFDTGDRMFLAGAGIASNYVYDDLGNTTTLPSIDTTNTAGDVTLAYQPDSQVKSISQAGIVKTFTQDPLGRNVATVETATGAPTVTIVNYFDDASDSPAWSVDSGLKWTRNISDLAGGLSVISSGTASSTAATSTKTLTSSSVQLTDMHGDVVTTMDATAGANTPTSTSAYDEYGAVLSSPTPTPPTYGWLGSQQRSTANAGLSLMGVRLYNPTTGRFLQTDPVPGGSPNAYAYPTDPIMGFDLDGRKWKFSFDDALTFASLVVIAAVFAGCVAACSAASLAIGVTSFGYHVYKGDSESAKLDAVGLAAGAGASAGKFLVKLAARGGKFSRLKSLTGKKWFLAQVNKLEEVEDKVTAVSLYLYNQAKIKQIANSEK